MLYTLKFKFIIASLLTISVIMAVSTWRDIQDTKQRLLDSQKDKARLISQSIMHSMSNLMLNNRWHELQSMMEDTVAGSEEISEVRIFNPENGSIVASSEAGEIGSTIYSEDMEVYRNRSWSNVFVIEKQGRNFASKLTPIHNRADCRKCHDQKIGVLGVLDLEISLSGLEESIVSSKRKHLEHGFIAFLIMSGGILLVVSLLIDRPMSAMIRTIRNIERGDMSARMKESRNEFGIMAGSFNRMLDAVESSSREVEQCHSQQMERAAKLASLGEIISGIAHEIKNPLAGISCAVQVFHADMKEGDSRKMITSEILDHIKRLDNIVKGLLNYAKPKPPSFEKKNITDVLEKAVFFVYPEAKKHNVTIDTAIDSAPEIMMDSDQIQQVFLNLMINAVQAMPDGGTLKIVASESDIDTMELGTSLHEAIHDASGVSVSFEDNGQGIDPETQKHVFDPFITKKSKGTGLGLSISRRIVQEHGGDIIMRSEAGKGSTFTVYLPKESA